VRISSIMRGADAKPELILRHNACRRPLPFTRVDQPALIPADPPSPEAGILQ
jgi:hypothetical protein